MVSLPNQGSPRYFGCVRAAFLTFFLVFGDDVQQELAQALLHLQPHTTLHPRHFFGRFFGGFFAITRGSRVCY